MVPPPRTSPGSDGEAGGRLRRHLLGALAEGLDLVRRVAPPRWRRALRLAALWARALAG